MSKIKHSIFCGGNRCAYCGRNESVNSGNSSGWFGSDSDGDKICDVCAAHRQDQEEIVGELCNSSNCQICQVNPASLMAHRRHQLNPPTREFMRSISQKPRKRK